MFLDFSSDLRTAARMIARSPGTSALIVFTLALAIGASTIGFAFADLALFRGLPVDDTSRVVSLFGADTHGDNRRGLLSGPDFLDLQARTRTLTHIGAYRDASAALIQNGQSRTLRVGWASAEFFTAMGQPAVRGRVFAAGDDRAGASPVAVLSHRYWQDAMAGRATALGHSMQIGREAFTIVGVVTPEMEWANLALIDVWLPLRLSPEMPRDKRQHRVVARLRDGQTLASAAAEIGALADALATEHPDTNTGWKVRVVPATEMAGDDEFWAVIALFLFSIGLLMAIATANVSNLVLARAVSRQRELAVRTALGARRGRLVRQLGIEGLLLSACGALLALPVAWAGLRAITAISPEVVFQQLHVDSHEFGFMAVLALICPVVFCVAPARALGRTDMRQLFASGGRGATVVRRGRAALVVAQLALAVILLTASTLALRSVRNIYASPTGLHTSGVSWFTVDFNEAQYPDEAAVGAAARATRAALTELPGVQHAAAVTALPILGAEAASAMIVDGAVANAGDARPSATVTGTSADWAHTAGLTLLAGSWWSDGDEAAAVVSRSVAVRHLGGIDAAIGHQLTLHHGTSPLTVRVVGVSSDVAGGTIKDAAPPRIWAPIASATRRVTYVVRSQADPSELAGAIRSTLARTAPAVPIENLQTLDAALARAASSDYVVIGMLGAFAVLALVLAATGLFGVVSYAAAERTAEFGTRMALGARAADVMYLVARQSLLLLAIGLSLGLAGGVAVGFSIRGLLYGTSPTDPITLGGVALLLAAVTLAATALPAWRASRIDPVTALRAE